MHEEETAPDVRLLESMRSVGYSLEAALADLLDNSITAHSSSIEIDGDVVEGEYLAVLDDGDGMSPEAAREALRLAGNSGSRDPDDLGRFGLGLKTASLSQARCVTVLTKRDGRMTALRWDIDHVLESGRWGLLILDERERVDLPLWDQLSTQEHGTLVIWHHLDLLLGDSADRGAFLRERLYEARDALALVFHRYLRSGKGGVTIRVNGAALNPVDPFLESNSRTQVSPTEELKMGGEVVRVTAFTLPHPTGLTPAERARRDLSTGMRDAQGFYVYRNRRLISHGSWFGLASKNELTKQTRIRVDIPNTLDHLWQLDIKKSRAEPPASFKAHLKRLIDPLLERGRRVHTYRGRRPTDAVVHVWDKVVQRDGRVSYVVNQEHPLVRVLRGGLDSSQERLLDAVFENLASTFPAQDLYAELASSKLPPADLLSESDVAEKLVLLAEAGGLGANVDEATAHLSTIEPFNRIDHLRRLVETAMEQTKIVS